MMVFGIINQHPCTDKSEIWHEEGYLGRLSHAKF